MKRTAESVTEGHPDKLCDQIADGIVDACLAADPKSHTAVEVMASKNMLFLAGEMSPELLKSGAIQIEAIARKTAADIGYTSEAVGLDAAHCLILTNINAQSADIDAAVSKSDTIETAKWIAGKVRCRWLPPEDQMPGAHDKARHVGAGDQGIMYGYATDETETFMPLPFVMATALSKRLAAVRKDGTLPWLRPDGKSQVTLDGDHKVSSIVVSAQHDPSIALADLQQAIAEHVIVPVFEKTVGLDWITADTQIHINPSGRFVIGGPLGDTGVTGRKLMVDTYGGACHHGGGAFSGKDPTKVDRSGAYMARYLAKNIVGCGLAEKCEVALAFAIGREEPEMFEINTFGTAKAPESQIKTMIERNVSFAVPDIITGLNLAQPIYQATAAYGHFGQPDRPWEKIDAFESVKK
ncbi:methionine adenosyltransferase [Pseudoramibacter porci]|uniref:Methionine adenosyltransferase n=1 Tax=Pseudoramibacter porci TaxID=2606631 RepID=A0A7X2NH60_9FIRM|nr:methionine adenosyltransferase [Pseudoramibacter porci]MSS20414.1 methionine adenosyltransferase [Pseudoramibacter porci]